CSLTLDDEARAGDQRRDAGEGAAGRGDVSGAQETGDRDGIGLAIHQPARQDRLRLRGKEQSGGRAGIVQGLLAHPVAGEHQPLRARVPQGEPEHALELVDEIEPALLVEMRDHLGVAARPEAMARALETLAQRAVVVDLPVADDQHVAALVRERLRAVLDVDDREAPAAESRPSLDARPIAVGTAVDQRATHPAEGDPVRLEAGAHHHTIDAAHQPGPARCRPMATCRRSLFLDARRMAAGRIPQHGPGRKPVAQCAVSIDIAPAVRVGSSQSTRGGLPHMGMRSSSLAVLLLLSATRGSAATCSDPAALGIDLSRQAFCDPLVPEQCMLPFPNDYFTVADSQSPTRRRIHFTPEGLPKNASDVPLEAAELNRSDGFSPGAAVLFWMPQADLVRSNAPAINNIGRSLEPDSPIVIIDARNGKRVPLWAERDLLSAPGSQSLILRPAIDYTDGHRYIVAIRRMIDGDGNRVTPSPAFVAYRDGTCTTDATFEARRPAMEKIFQTLRAAGIERESLLLAWDFTVASTKSTTGRMLHIRDDAFKVLGGKAPAFTVTSVQENPSPQFRRRIQGTFQVPLYLTGDGSPGQRFALGPDGLPQRQALPFTATFTCNLPNSAVPGPARMSMYGHGLLGDQSEVNGSLV